MGAEDPYSYAGREAAYQAERKEREEDIRYIRYARDQERGRSRGGGSGGGKIGGGLATGLLIWGLIALAGNGDLAPYLLGAAGLLYVASAIVWIIRHPIRALVGFVLFGALVFYAFSKMVTVSRMDTPDVSQTTTKKKPTGKVKPSTKAKTPPSPKAE